MPIQSRSPIKLLRTTDALVRFVFRMTEDVIFELTFRCESFGALRAAEVFYFEVRLQVDLHITSISEVLVANRARK